MDVLGMTGMVGSGCLSGGVGAMSRIGSGLASTRATSTFSAAAGFTMGLVRKSAPSPNNSAWHIADIARPMAFRLRTADTALAKGIGQVTTL
jgi:hypothetical protein